MGDALTNLSSAHCWVCGVSQCHHLHVTDLATKSQILQMNPNDFLKFFLIFLPQLLKSHLFYLGAVSTFGVEDGLCGFVLTGAAQGREGHRACGPSVGVPRGKCLCSDSGALPFPAEPRAVFRVCFQDWLYHSIVSKGGGGSTASCALCHSLSQCLAPAQVLAWSHWQQQVLQEPTVPSDPPQFHCSMLIQRCIIPVLRQTPVTPCCRYSFKLPK